MSESIQQEVYGHLYRIGKMDAIRQFHVTRKLAAVSAGLGEGIARLQAGGGAKALLSEGAGAMRVITPLMEAVGRMSNEDAEYVIGTCLGVVQRNQGVGGAPAWSPVQASPGILMFPDIQMSCMIALVWRVMEFNLGGFFSELLSVLPAPEPEIEK